MYNFSLSGFYERLHILKYFVESPHLKEDVSIFSVFDSFPNIIWNGGRNSLSTKEISKEDIETTIKYYNEKGISLRYTFSNLLIRREHLNDKLGNLCLETAHNEMNSVTVSTDIMKNYIRKNYPKYKIIWSLTTNNKNIDYLKGKLNDLDFVAFPPDLIKNFFVLEKFTIDERKKIEILVNENCDLYCPDRSKHYLQVSKKQLEGVNKDKTKLLSCKPVSMSIQNDIIGNRPLHIKYEDLKKYEDMGINHFKIQGRDSILDEAYIGHLNHYLIKEEYKELYKTIPTYDYKDCFRIVPIK